MSKEKTAYEAVFVVSLKLSEEKIKEVVEKFTSLISSNGELESVEEWGKRRLAYEINFENEGFYVLVNFKADGSFIAELERIFGITDGILRSLVVKKVEA